MGGHKMIGLLIFGFVVLSVICLWILIERRKDPKFLIWFIPTLLILISSTYLTYDAILGLPRNEIPEKGYYLKHYVDEPNWIYLWVVEKDRIPRNYRIVYSRKVHEQMEGVKGESEQGKYMVLGKDSERGSLGEEGKDKNPAGGFTIGGDMNFYEWDHETMMPPKE